MLQKRLLTLQHQLLHLLRLLHQLRMRLRLLTPLSHLQILSPLQMHQLHQQLLLR